LPFSFGDSPINAGDKVQVGCTVAKGDQPLRISWNFYGEELSSNMGISTMAVGDSMNVLFIPFVAPSNRGNYTCVVNNPAGHDSYTAQLLVNGIQLCTTLSRSLFSNATVLNPIPSFYRKTNNYNWSM